MDCEVGGGAGISEKMVAGVCWSDFAVVKEIEEGEACEVAEVAEVDGELS